MKSIQFVIVSVLSLYMLLTGCEDDLPQHEETPFAPYILSLGITSAGQTTYYVVSTNDLMSGTINAIGKGIEQNGYHDYEQGNQTVFSIGGLGVTHATGIVRNSNGLLVEKGDFVFNHSLSAFTSVDNQTMLGMEIPANPESGNLATFYKVDISSVEITQKQTVSIFPLAEIEWPSITGMCYRDGKVYVTYMQMNPKTFDTEYTDTTYVAIFDYEDMSLETVLKDTRTGPAGSWNAFNGIFKTESGDLYIMSNSSLANGFSKSTKNASFLRIPAGKQTFDDYHFDFERVTGGLKPAHIKYIGNGLVLAQVSTLNPQTLADRWGDKSLKCCIIDLLNQTVHDVEGIPVHNGNGGRRFNVLVEGGYVFLPVTTSEGTYVYRVDPKNAVAEKGAKISTTFVGGFFKLD